MRKIGLMIVGILVTASTALAQPNQQSVYDFQSSANDWMLLADYSNWDALSYLDDVTSYDQTAATDAYDDLIARENALCMQFSQQDSQDFTDAQNRLNAALGAIANFDTASLSNLHSTGLNLEIDGLDHLIDGDVILIQHENGVAGAAAGAINEYGSAITAFIAAIAKYDAVIDGVDPFWELVLDYEQAFFEMDYIIGQYESQCACNPNPPEYPPLVGPGQGDGSTEGDGASSGTGSGDGYEDDTYYEEETYEY